MKIFGNIQEKKKSFSIYMYKIAFLWKWKQIKIISISKLIIKIITKLFQKILNGYFKLMYAHLLMKSYAYYFGCIYIFKWMHCCIMHCKRIHRMAISNLCIFKKNGIMLSVCLFLTFLISFPYSVNLLMLNKYVDVTVAVIL